MANYDIGFDLGTTSIIIYVVGKGIVVKEPSVIAVNQKTGEVLAIGEKAQEMASTLGLRCEILPGKQSYLRTLLTGPWTQEQFLILPPGSMVEREMLSKRY